MKTKTIEQAERKLKTLESKVDAPAHHGAYLPTPEFYFIHGQIKALKWFLNKKD